MDVLEAIHHRRSNGDVSEEIPPRKEIEQILEAARWAPNHHKTEPWHFFILTGEGRDKLGQVLGKINVEKLNAPDEQQKQQAWESGMKKARRSPVIIVSVVEPNPADKIEKVEEIAACACSIQNMLLTAHDQGLVAKWRTGKSNYHSAMKEAFGVSEEGMVLGAIYIGYATAAKAPVPKKSIDEYTTWIST